MRINAKSSLTLDDVRGAINQARGDFHQDIYLEEGWTTPRGRVEFFCNSAHGKFSTGRNGDHGRAASWTAWGYVIAELFARDPDAHIGFYRGADDFKAKVWQEVQARTLRDALGCSDRSDRGRDYGFLDLV